MKLDPLIVVSVVHQLTVESKLLKTPIDCH